MAGESVAIVWGNHRNDQRFHTHHSFWEAAFADLGYSVERYIWPEIFHLPTRNHALYLFVDYSPVLYRVAELGLKNAGFFCWDAHHMSAAILLQVTPLFKRSYFAELGSVNLARTYGLPVSWLPPAFYEGVFRPLEGRPKVHDYSFVGQMDGEIWRNGDTKRSFIDRVTKMSGVHGYLGYGVYGEAVNGIYNDAAILFERTIFPSIGTRFFELIGSGGFVLMNRLGPYSGIEMLARDGEHYVSYDDTFEDFERKFRYYLGHPEEREKIAKAAQAHFIKNHTYAARAKVILSDFGLL